MRKNLMLLRLFLCSLPLCLTAMPAFAYITPGPGLTMIGSLIALIGSVVVALAMVLFWPLRMMYKKLRGGKPSAPASGDSQPPAS